MSKPVKVGIFIVAGIALFCVGLFLIGSRKHLFGDYFIIYTQFNDLDTLQPGAKVRVSGMDAGQVTDIDIPKAPSSEFRLRLKIEKNFRPMVRQDSVASIETEGMVGNKFVNIQKGSASSPECAAHCTLKGQESASMAALMRQGGDLAKTMQSTIDDLRTRADGAIQNITSLTGHADGLIQAASPNIQKIASNSAHLTGNANVLVAGIRQGHGAAGKILVDKTVASDVQTTIANASQSSAKANTVVSQIQNSELPQVHQTLQNAQDMTAQMNQAVGAFLAPGGHNENTAVALRDAAHSAQRTASNLADDTEAIKHNFFLRGFFKRRGFYDFATMTPEKYAATRFVKKPRARVWIPAAGLFETGPQGAQRLSVVGHSILDQFMSELLPYLPNNPIVVEGYAVNGSPDQRYIASQQRADEVRSYLQSRFHLDPKRVGAMPLADHPLIGRKTWDGVCLVLVISKK
jgi:phospholipid/cholesterol/gamma-HCH transport system substrate-binding protein